MNATHTQLILRSGPEGRTITLDEYRQAGGYAGLTRALKEFSPAEVKKIILDSGLRGLGGAGFPAGRKWTFLAEDAPFPRYVIANVDEREPGTFKDRVLVSVNPHTLLEGMIIACYAVSSHRAVFFVRPCYDEACRIFERALHEAGEAGLVGKDILGSPFSCEVAVHRSAGRYICGESSGLVRALEGKRPHPNIEGHLTSAGLWGRPTIVNNAETLAYVPHILREGPAWFRSLGRGDRAPGNKIYTVSGRVNRPGAFELPFGTSLQEIIEGHAGGMQPGYTYKTCLPGGGSTRFLPKKYYDIAMDYESLQKVGQRLGTGSIVVFDQKTCLVGAAVNLLRFFSRESCGWCTPCREGLPYMYDLLRRIENGEGKEAFIPMLREMCRHMSKAYCFFAPGAAAPVESLLEDFLDEVQEHISQRRCPFDSQRCPD